MFQKSNYNLITVCFKFICIQHTANNIQMKGSGLQQPRPFISLITYSLYFKSFYWFDWNCAE